MIKLIVSDVDGTMIQGEHTAHVIPPEMFPLIQQCQSRGIIFAVASGRTYSNLKQMFAAIWQDLYFIADNGNVTIYQDRLQHSVAYPFILAMELVAHIKSLSSCPIVITTPFSIYLEKQPDWFRDMMYYDVGNTMTYLPDLDFLRHEKIVKVSAYVDLAEIDAVERKLKAKWSDQIKVTRSGGCWIDMSLTGKGAAVRRLADDFEINRSEIMVFGDNYNDEEMFLSAEHSYCMATADEYLQSKAAHVVPNVPDVLREFLAEQR